MIRGIHHIGIAVRNLDDFIDIYKSLGFVVSSQEYVRSQNVDIVMMKSGDIFIEFVCPHSFPGDRTPIDHFLNVYGEGLHHICFSVDSLDDVKRSGFNFISDPCIGFNGMNIGFVHPRFTGGVLWEFVEI